MGQRCWFLNLGKIGYREALRLQEKLLEERRERLVDDLLLLLEHNPVITIGRGGNPRNILAPPTVLREEGIEVQESDRGGDVAYHGPGQLVGYPILDLKNYKKDVHWYILNLERVLIKTLAEYGLPAGILKGYTGVWVGEEKVAAIGISIRSWITKHGFALNVDPLMNHFAYINPCGIMDKKVTSLVLLLGRKVSLSEIQEKLIYHFGEVFRVEMVEGKLCDLGNYEPELISWR